MFLQFYTPLAYTHREQRIWCILWRGIPGWDKGDRWDVCFFFSITHLFDSIVASRDSIREEACGRHTNQDTLL